ncbi:MAG: tRNA (guanosine(37)-N1)-methyltransferase TrmD [Hasllibacter sp.]
MPKSHGRLSISAAAAPRDLMDPQRLAKAWTASVVTLFPEIFPGPLGASLTGRALAEGLWQLRLTDLRAHGLGRHRQVDDAPFGGGPGLVIRADVADAALTEARQGLEGAPVLYLSPRGRRIDQAMAKALAAGPGAVFLCGRFEGVDERVLEAHGAVEVSLGDFVMTGGELAAMALIDASLRHIGGVLGNQASVEEESFATGLLEHPQYTRPADWKGRAVPEVLLSGDHGAVARWRRSQAKRLTKERRPDLWRAHIGDGDEDQSARTAQEQGGKPAS